MAAALVGQTNDNRQARALKAPQEQDLKLPSERFKVTLPILLEYLLVADEALLPPKWHLWLNRTKKQEVQVLRDYLDSFARTAEAFSTSTPFITPRLVQEFLEFNFLGTGADDIKGGLQPFIIVDGNSKQWQSNLETARLYGLLMAGDASISLADLEALSSKEIKSIPLTYWELEKTLGMFGNLIRTLLGAPHPLTVAFCEIWNLLQTNLHDDIHNAIDYKHQVKPVHILRSIQLTFYTWFMHKRSQLTPPTLDLKHIWQCIIMQTYTTPKLPPQLYN
jgi:hypothetical protein